MARHRPNWRRVKLHRPYSVGEAAHTLGVSNLTIRRWIKNGLPALIEKRPTLIRGEDLLNLGRARNKRKSKLCLNELYCFRCRSARTPAGDMIDYVPRTALMGRITGLCGVCEGTMHKAVSVAKLPELCRVLEVSFPQGRAHLNEATKPNGNDDFRQEPMT